MRAQTANTRLAAALLLAGVAGTVVSRTLVAYAGIPSVVNFVHYPLILGATVLLISPAGDKAFFMLCRSISLFLAASVTSWIWNGGQSIVAVALNWLVFVEPFLIVACVVELARRGYPVRYAERTATWLLLVQLPFALVQFATVGLGDPVQGMLIGQGAGAHVLGFMGMVVALWSLGSIVHGSSHHQGRDLAILGLGFIIGVITDAKQGLALFVAVSPLLVLSPSVRRHHGAAIRRAFSAVVLVALTVAAFQLNTSSNEIANVERRDTFVSSKLDTVVEYFADMREGVGGVVFGLGPGRTASRVAWLAPGDDTLSDLGVTASDTTVRLYRLWNNDPESDTSTAAAPFFSWLGVFGDVGLLGLAAYGWCWVLMWRLTGPVSRGWTAKVLVAFVLTLGLLFNWLEEPALMSTAALLLGVAIARERAYSLPARTPEPPMSASPPSPPQGRLGRGLAGRPAVEY